MEEINEEPIIEKGLTVEIVETIKEEIIEEVVNNLDEVKLDDRNIHAPIILVGDTKTKFIDFIGVERFDLIINSHLVNIVNCMSVNGEEVQVIQSMTFKFGKKTKKMKYSKYLFSWYIWEISDFKDNLKYPHVDVPQRCLYKDSKRNQLHMEYCTDKHMPIT